MSNTQYYIHTLKKFTLIIGTFCIPFNIQFFTYSIILFVLLSLFTLSDVKQIIKSMPLFFKSVYLLLIAYYVYDCIGFLWTSDYDTALFDIQVKLSFLVLPIILYFYHYQYHILVLSTSFVFGCIVVSLLLLIRFLLKYFILSQIVYYSDFSIFVHPTYFSLYLNVSLILLMYIKPIEHFFNRFKYLIYTILVLSVLLSTSKAGIITLGITFFSILVINYFSLPTKKRIYYIISSLVVLISLYALFKPVIHNRFDVTIHVLKNYKVINPETSYLESNAIRLFTWKATIELIKDNFMIGTGTGDIKNELIKKYSSMNAELLVEKKLNSHNQFLQDFAKLGILNFILLISIFIYPLILSRFNTIVWITLLIFFINLLFESIFETQNGSIFFPFIITNVCLLLQNIETTSVPLNKTNMRLY